MTYDPSNITLAFLSKDPLNLADYQGLAGRVLVPLCWLDTPDKLSAYVAEIRAHSMKPAFLVTRQFTTDNSNATELIFQHQPEAIVVRLDSYCVDTLAWLGRFRAKLKMDARRKRRESGCIKFRVPPTWIWHSPCYLESASQSGAFLNWLAFVDDPNKAFKYTASNRRKHPRCFSGLILPEPFYGLAEDKVGKSLHLVADVSQDNFEEFLCARPEADLLLVA